MLIALARALCIPAAGTLGIYLVSLAIARFQDILEQTAAGTAEIRWPDDAVIDRAVRALHLVGLAVFWLLWIVIPLGTLAALGVRHVGALAALASFMILWLIWPISVLSSLSGVSIFFVLRWEILTRLLPCWRRLLDFYVFTGPVLAFAWSCWYMALHGWKTIYEEATTTKITWLPDAVELWSWLFVLPIAVFATATGWLIYARLLGRLAWIMNQLDPPEPRGIVEPPLPPTPVPVPMPSAYPDGPPAPTEKIYGFKDDGPPVAVADAPKVLEVLPAAPPRADDEAATTAAEESGPRRLPKLVTPTVLVFPWSRQAVGVWAALIVLGMTVGLMVRFLLAEHV
jgi:hypothetical protein